MQLKTLAVLSTLVMAAPVLADPIHVNVGADYGGNSNYVGSTNSTGLPKCSLPITLIQWSRMWMETDN